MIKTIIRPPKTEFRKQLKLKIITDANDYKNDYEGFTVFDFQDGTSSYNGLELIDLKVSGKKNNILTFVVEGYFSDVTEAAIKFAESFTTIDYDISDIISNK